MTYPHVLAFPLHLAIMTDASFPFPAIGTVHLENSLTQHRPLLPTESFQLTVRPRRSRPHPKGRVFDLVTTVHARGELVWEETSTFLRRAPASGLPVGHRVVRGAGRPMPRQARRMAAGRRPRPPLRRGLRRPQPDPPAPADGQGVRLPAADRARDVEPGPLPGRRREPAARRGPGRRARSRSRCCSPGRCRSAPLPTADGQAFALTNPKDGSPHLVGRAARL